MASYPRRSIVQVTNISSSATSEQLRTLFGYLGVVEELVLYNDEKDDAASKVCYVRYQDPRDADVALHLNNTAFLDRVLIVLPLASENNEIPDEKFASLVRAPANTAAGILPRTYDWPLDVISMVVGRPGEQVIQTTEPRLAVNAFPAYPPLAPTTDGARIEEIRRTILVTNLEPNTTGEEVLEFFNKHAEVRCVRLAGTDSEKVAYIEFTHQPSIHKAFSLMGATLNGRQIMIQHSNCTIIKQASNITVVDDGSKSVENNHNSRHSDRGRSRSRSRRRHSGSRHRSSSKRRNSRSKERRRSRSRRSHGKRSRTRSRSRSRVRRRSRSCSRDRRRTDRGRSRSYNRRRYRRSRSISDWRYSRSRSRGRPVERRDREYERIDHNFKERERIRDRIRERDHDYERRHDRMYDHDKERTRDRGRERERERDKGRDRENNKERDRNRERPRDHIRERDRAQNHDRSKESTKERTREAEQRDRDRNHNRDKHKDRHSESSKRDKEEKKSPQRQHGLKTQQVHSPNGQEVHDSHLMETETSNGVECHAENSPSNHHSQNGANSYQNSNYESDDANENALESTIENESVEQRDVVGKLQNHIPSSVVNRPTVLGVKLAGPEDMDYLAYDNEADWKMALATNDDSSSDNDSPTEMIDATV